MIKTFNAFNFEQSAFLKYDNLSSLAYDQHETCNGTSIFRWQEVQCIQLYKDVRLLTLSISRKM